METVVMMYVLPMLLGQTYDFGKDQPGIQIFSPSALNSTSIIEHYVTDSQHRMVENSDQMRDFLDVSGKLSLRIKNGMVDVKGEGSYIKDSSSLVNGIEILVKVHFETVTETIPTWVTPKADWNLQSAEFLGTHYCRSIIYGGDLIASIRISAKTAYDMEKIKGAITGGIQGGSSFKANVQGKLEKLKRDAQDSSSMEISYYATVPIKGVSYTVDGLLKLIEDFPKHVKEVNNGKGNPLRMELHTLSSLKEGFPQYMENRALNDQLDDLEDQFDDLRSTRKELGLWVSKLPPVIPKNVNSMIGDFTKKLDEIFGIFSKSIFEMDLAVGASMQSFEDAFDAYKADGHILPQKYIRKFRKLQKDIYEQAPELKPKVGGAFFVRWGKPTCEGSLEAETSSSGVAIASVVSSNGGWSNFKCSPIDPDLVEPAGHYHNYVDDTEESKDKLFIIPLLYNGITEAFKDMRNKTLSCAECRVRNRTSTIIKVAAKTCPDEWYKEYDGLLMAPGVDSSKGEYICVDSHMQAVSEKMTFGSTEQGRVMDVKEVTVKCGSLPCKNYPEEKRIPCVVCTI